jgi:hypothetical protein
MLDHLEPPAAADQPRAGIAWILPLKPILQWIETGRFKP